MRPVPIILLCSSLISLRLTAQTGDPHPVHPIEDPVAVFATIQLVEPWIAEQIELIEQARGPEQVNAIAGAISARTDSLVRQFRKAFPDEGDGWTMFSLYNGLASAVACENPGLAAVYRSVGTVALYADDDPYRPKAYQALIRLSDHAWSLSKAKNPQRMARLVEKLRADHVDLIADL